MKIKLDTTLYTMIHIINDISDFSDFQGCESSVQSVTDMLIQYILPLFEEVIQAFPFCNNFTDAVTRAHGVVALAVLLQVSYFTD